MTFTFTFYDSDGSVIDLTGCTIFTTVKQNPDDDDAVAKILTTMTLSATPTDGTATWSITSATTQYMLGQYYWDVQIKYASTLVETVIRDIFEVLQDQTIRTSV